MTCNSNQIFPGAGEVAIVTLVDGACTSCASPGAKMLVGTDAVLGSLGSPVLDRHAVEAGRAALADGCVKTCRVPPGGDKQGEARLLVEPYMPPLELLVLGGGHIARPLAMLGNMLGYEVTVVDDRPEFAARERFPEATRVICGDFVPVLRDLDIGNWTSVVIVTRGHRHDYRCLVEVLGSRAAYIGMIGSKRKVNLLREQLVKDGFAALEIDRVHMPIGLDIGAQTPEEIALSIAAELVKVRRGGTAASLTVTSASTPPGRTGEIRTRDDMNITGQALALARQGTRAALATIIEASGSTPRKTGARMAVFADGHCLGTVGGGVAEAAAQEAARQVIAEDRPRLLKMALDAESAAAEGMVCGGGLEIFIEPLTILEKLVREMNRGA